MRTIGDITYFKFLSDGINKEYTCSFVQCLNCAVNKTLKNDDERIGRTTQSRQARAV